MFNSLRQQVTRLADSDGDDPAPRSRDSRNGVSDIFGRSPSRRKPPKDEYQKYWRTFETVPLVRESIRDFAAEVVEPGWRVTANDSKTEEALREWAEQCAIIAGERDNDILPFLKQAIIQREVRGTVLIELVPGSKDDDSIAGLKFINPETVSIYTVPNKALLPKPEDSYDTVPKNSKGESVAYVQYDDELGYNDKNSVKFTKDQIAKFVRDPDTGDLRGTSRIESIQDRLDGLKQKLSDNDEAIAAKAYPVWLFLMGSEDFPWTEEEIESFMEKHDEENFSPGMKQAISGDIDIETVSGEVAEIAESLKFDVDWIMSSMPMPKYALGGFEENINQFVSQQQENRIEKQKKEARGELEKEMTDIFRRKAEMDDELSPEGVEFMIEREEALSPILDDDVNLEEVQQYAAAIKSISGGNPARVMTGEELRKIALLLPPEDLPDAFDAEKMGDGKASPTKKEAGQSEETVEIPVNQLEASINEVAKEA